MEILSWMSENLLTVIAVAVFLVSVLNSLTKHFSGADSKVGKLCLWALEVLSLLKSTDVDGQPMKLPFTSKPPGGKNA